MYRGLRNSRERQFFFQKIPIDFYLAQLISPQYLSVLFPFHQRSRKDTTSSVHHYQRKTPALFRIIRKPKNGRKQKSKPTSPGIPPPLHGPNIGGGETKIGDINTTRQSSVEASYKSRQRKKSNHPYLRLDPAALLRTVPNEANFGPNFCVSGNFTFAISRTSASTGQIFGQVHYPKCKNWS